MPFSSGQLPFRGLALNTTINIGFWTVLNHLIFISNIEQLSALEYGFLVLKQPI